jgi:ethanolamine utilization protein EutQ
MKKARHFKASAMDFEAFGGPPGKAAIARLVGPDMSATMGAGIATFDGCSIEWTVLYDEVIVVLHGTFRLKLGKGFAETIEASPGDVIWLP